jgi:hypothetical protein
MLAIWAYKGICFSTSFLMFKAFSFSKINIDENTASAPLKTNKIVNEKMIPLFLYYVTFNPCLYDIKLRLWTCLYYILCICLNSIHNYFGSQIDIF